MRSLCHKILQNVSTLLHADRGSLFLVQGERGGGCMPSSQNHEPSPGNPAGGGGGLGKTDNGSPEHRETGYSRSRCLVSKLFDVCSRSTLLEMEKKDEIKIPWGTGIVGYVAESGEPVNIPDAYKVSVRPLSSRRVEWYSGAASSALRFTAFPRNGGQLFVTFLALRVQFEHVGWYDFTQQTT